MHILYTLIVSLITLLLLAGIGYFIYRTVVKTRMINNTENGFTVLLKNCKDINKASRCYVNALITDIGFDRSASIINDKATPTPKEAALIAADSAKCALQNC
jgi:hypothetical protein